MRNAGTLNQRIFLKMHARHLSLWKSGRQKAKRPETKMLGPLKLSEDI